MELEATAQQQLCSALIPGRENEADASKSQNGDNSTGTPLWSLVAGNGQQCPTAASAVHSFLDGENASYTLCRHQGSDARGRAAGAAAGRARSARHDWWG
eukprot:COSAG01_NODE_59691_length_299_cov_0.390000_1_plen_99_part_11